MPRGGAVQAAAASSNHRPESIGSGEIEDRALVFRARGEYVCTHRTTQLLSLDVAKYREKARDYSNG